MPFTRIEITDFRNFEHAQLEPISSGFNLIYGINGSGKTSLLEAIYNLSLGRSFRSVLSSRIIRQGSKKFQIFAQKINTTGQTIPIGIERNLHNDLKIRIAGNSVQSIAELADLTPVQIINSNCFNLLDGGPNVRRKYLDWGNFYFNNDFLKVWRDVNQIIKQRNASLRQRCSLKEIEIWSNELTVKALLLNQLRQEYIDALLPIFRKMVNELLPLEDLEISFYPGWNNSENYTKILSATLDKDIQLGYTQFGPHRADFKIKTKGLNAKDILSRGQQKLFVCAMILAQGELLNNDRNKQAIYLIDDLPSELDAANKSRLIALLSKQNTQIFVTAVEKTALSDCLSREPLRMFHVEHGKVKTVQITEQVSEYNHIQTAY